MLSNVFTGFPSIFQTILWPQNNTPLPKQGRTQKQQIEGKNEQNHLINGGHQPFCRTYNALLRVAKPLPNKHIFKRMQRRPSLRL